MASYLQQYIDFLRANKETHCCKKLGQCFFDDLEPIVQGKSDKFYFDEKAGNYVIRFIQGDIPDLDTFEKWMEQVPREAGASNFSKVKYLERHEGKFLGFIRQSKGEWADLPLVLQLFQKAIIQAIYGIKRRDTKMRRFTEVWIEIGRKNGKTTLQVPFALWALFEEPGAEVYVAASTYAQARRLWDSADLVREKSPALSAELKRRVNPRCDIYYPKNNSHFYALSKNTKSQDGFNSSCNIIDEAHALPDEVYNILKDATANTRQPLTNIIGTAGFVRGALFDNKYEYYSKVLNHTIEDDKVLIIIYELDDKEEMWDETKWYKSNPGLGPIKKIDYLRDKVNKAKNDMTVLNDILTKDFNVINVSNTSWLTAEIINNGAYANYDHEIVDKENLLKEYLKKFDGTTTLGGFDLSRTNDLTAFTTLLFDQDKNCVIAKTMYWCTKSFLDSPEAKSSGVPWLAWINKGYIRISTTPNQINYHDVADYVMEQFQKHEYFYEHINYDSYSANYLVEELASMGWSRKSCLIPTPQGFKTLSVPMQTMEAFLKDKKLCYLNNPVTKWMFTNVELVSDRNGNLMPKKAGDHRGNKIDGPATILDGFVSLCENVDAYLGEKGR